MCFRVYPTITTTMIANRSRILAIATRCRHQQGCVLIITMDQYTIYTRLIHGIDFTETYKVSVSCDVRTRHHVKGREKKEEKEKYRQTITTQLRICNSYTNINRINNTIHTCCVITSGYVNSLTCNMSIFSIIKIQDIFYK